MITDRTDPTYGKITYDTRETFYHVRTQHGWIGEVNTSGDPADHPTVSSLKAFTDHQPFAHIYSRQGAIRAAMVHGGTPVMITRTGKVRIVRD